MSPKILAALPADPGTDLSNPANLPTGFSSLPSLTPSAFLKTGVNLLLIVAGIVSFFFLLVGGIQWILAGGDKEGTEKARKKITNSLIGLAIVFSAYALLIVIGTLFNVQLLNFRIPAIGQ